MASLMKFDFFPVLVLSFFFLQRQDEGGIDIVMTLNVFYLLLFLACDFFKIWFLLPFCLPKTVLAIASCPNV